MGYTEFSFEHLMDKLEKACQACHGTGHQQQTAGDQPATCPDCNGFKTVPTKDGQRLLTFIKRWVRKAPD